MIEPVHISCIKKLSKHFKSFSVIFVMLLIPLNVFSVNFTWSGEEAFLLDSVTAENPLNVGSEVDDVYITVNGDSLNTVVNDTVTFVERKEIALFTDSITAADVNPKAAKVFTPDPVRAVWLSALCPGLGQIYNRRYWKLPLVVGGFMGLGYGASWNNGMLTDYTRAYNDFMDNDPSTNSYMNLFPPTTSESDLNKSWLERTLKTRKDYYRRNRDLCVICMVGVYLIAMVDAYVDASLSNFDITPDLSMQVTPMLMQDPGTRLPALGCSLAFNF